MSANPMDLTGRTILLTGASSGIGRETAIVLSELNARVVLVARNRERLAETFQALDGSGHIIEPFDLNNVDAIPAWIKSIVSGIGPLHGVAHCAGIYDLTPIRVLTAARLDEVMRVNFSSAVFLTKALRQKGCHGDGASIVIVSSVSGLRGHSGILAYTASKTAVLGLVRSMAVELAGDGLRVNAVAPGVVITPMSQGIDEPVSDEITQLKSRHPLGLGQPRDVANGIAFLLSGAARWITGTTLTIDGGYLSQ